MPERIQYVDENDNPVGAGTREEAWANGYIMRHVHILLRDETNRVLLAKRSPLKKSSPNCWALSAAGHVDEGESYDSAASRELFEEIGVHTELTSVGKFRSQHPHPDGVGSVDAFITLSIPDLSILTLSSLSTLTKSLRQNGLLMMKSAI